LLQPIIYIFISLFSFAGICNTDFLKNSGTNIKKAYELRDPFKRKTRKRSSGLERTKKYLGTELSNAGSIEGVSLDNIVIVGVLLGGERRALAKISTDGGKTREKEIFILTEGMKLGLDNAVLKAILPGGIVVVEKIRNVYDQDEYIETIIPIVPE